MIERFTVDKESASSVFDKARTAEACGLRVLISVVYSKNTVKFKIQTTNKGN